ncbi:hypothetical protein PG997_001366 [Apiospora hydei]|uniref:Uncharacterized protein n=1 Tax=Apiospora hydei TaxID=1337664 RepID=A0ABR1XDH0_9PEZI
MVKLSEVQTLNAALAADSPKPLVAVFLGGTSGIGHMTARALASSVQQAGAGGAAHLSRGPQRAARGGDRRVAARAVSGGASTEGLDETMAILYYSRMRAIQQLTPLLLKSTLPATVVSVFAAGFEDEKKLCREDLSLRDLQRYGYLQVRSHLCYMHSMCMSQLAELHHAEKQLRLIHIFPGLVLTAAFHNPAYPAWFRGERMLFLASPVLYPAAAGDDSSRRGTENEKGGTVRGMDGRPGSGAYSLDWKGDDTHNQKVYAKLGDEGIEALKAQVWEHTNKAFEVIASGEPFTE